MTAPHTLLKSREALLLIAGTVLLGLIALRAPDFVAPGNLATVFTDSAILIILAIGQTAVILTRSIDLSVAANLAVTGMAGAMLNAAHPELPVPLLVLASAGMGLGLGAVNGLLVWRIGLPSIVVTLGTLTIFRGAAFVLSGGEWVNTFQMSPAYLALPRETLLGLPVLAWMAVAVIGLAALVFTRTAAGRALYAVGGNPVAAVYAGIDAGRAVFRAFCLSGLLAGLCGYLWVSRFAVAYVDVAAGFELDVIAACVIGGVSISGGVGSVAGAVLGALFLGVIKNALPIVGVSPFWQMSISGAIIIAAVILNTRAERAKGRIILRRLDAGQEAGA